MSNPFDQLVATASQTGRETHAGWNNDLFAEAARLLGGFVWKQSHHDTVATENYLRLLAEGVGRGFLTQSYAPEHLEHFSQLYRWGCLLEYWLNVTLPLELPKLPPARRSAVMARVWNLGENILRDQPWIDPYLLKKCVAHSPTLAELENQLNAWMEPLLQPPRQATWQPPFDTQQVDGRIIHPDFLPGEMGLAAPALVCVRDRRLDAIFGGVFLHEHPCRVISHHRDFRADLDRTPSVHVEFKPGQAVINGHVVALPYLNRVHSHLVCHHGAVVISALDSQRLWVIRCQ